MLREKPKLFTIGQFAALHGINKKTLMWYDECCFANKLRKFFKQSAKKKRRLKGF